MRFQLRVSDRTREAVVRRLGQGCVQGHLSVDTLAWRVERAYAARTDDELGPLLADLPPGGMLGALVERWRLWTPTWFRAGCVACTPPLPADPARGYVVGRSAGCDLVLRDGSVSRRHAELRLDGRRWLITDLGSRNGTQVNGWRVVEAHVFDGDELVMGKTRLRFHPPS
jgi:hypothetical protein